MRGDMRLAALALAGGELEDDFKRAGYEVANKAYLPIGDSTMLERVLSALRSAPSIGRIRCITQPDAFAATYGPRGADLCDDVVAPGGDLIDSLLLGFANLRADEMVVVAATDIPLVTAQALEAFVRRVNVTPCDVGYGFVRREPHMRAYPQVRHTWVHLREGTFCGAGVSVVRAGCAVRLAAILRDFLAARKSPLRLASLFSPFLVVRVMFGLVGVAELEHRADALSGLRCRGIPCDEPELAVNVDCLEDLQTVESIVRAAAAVAP
jgi:GTP:adenosylcobinamide-phosphate guanylyltransferase